MTTASTVTSAPSDKLGPSQESPLRCPRRKDWHSASLHRRNPRQTGAAPGVGMWVDAGPPLHSYGDPKQWAAFLGTPFLSGADGQLERVAHIYKHPFYNLYTLDYDVALLELAGPVHRSRLVRPICLPEPAPRPPDGARCVITGWGSVREGGRPCSGGPGPARGWLATGSPQPVSPAGSMVRQLQKAAVRLLSEQTCRRFYPVQISSRMLCAGLPQGGVDSCSVSPRVRGPRPGWAHPGRSSRAPW